MAQNKETKIEENNLSTPVQENANSILKPKLTSILQPKVGPHTRVWGNPKKEETTNNTVITQLPEEVQAKMENSFSQDFSNVNIHKDSSSAQDINAKAYAQGTDIHFAPGEYNPQSKEGQELIGHELTHVVQQSQGKVGSGAIHGKGLEINQDVSLEKEADDAGKLASEGKSVEVSGTGNGVQRKVDEQEFNVGQRYANIINDIHLLIFKLDAVKSKAVSFVQKVSNSYSIAYETVLKQIDNKKKFEKSINDLAIDVVGAFAGTTFSVLKSVNQIGPITSDFCKLVIDISKADAKFNTQNSFQVQPGQLINPLSYYLTNLEKLDFDFQTIKNSLVSMYTIIHQDQVAATNYNTAHGTSNESEFYSGQLEFLEKDYWSNFQIIINSKINELNIPSYEVNQNEATNECIRQLWRIWLPNLDLGTYKAPASANYGEDVGEIDVQDYDNTLGSSLKSHLKQYTGVDTGSFFTTDADAIKLIQWSKNYKAKYNI